jgi:hypothetical protein
MGVVVLVTRIRLVAKLIERIRQRYLSCDAILIHITKMFVLQAICLG